MLRLKKYGPIAALAFAAAACKVPAAVEVTPNRAVPAAYAGGGTDTTNSAQTRWRQFFTDPYLQRLIDTALTRNQEVLSTFQEIQIAKSDILFRQGALRPTVGARLGLGVEKVGRYTSQGAGDASTEIVDGKEVPDPLTDITASLYARWEVDIWNKLRTAKKAAVLRYLSTLEGRNFLYTNLVAEVAASYNELLALDNQLAIVRQNIALQGNALELVKVQKEASRVTELAVQKFSAEVYHTQSLEFGILQQIRETENRLHLLLGHYPQPIERAPVSLLDRSTPPVQAGLPAQLLAARPDIRQAELELSAAKLDVQVARKEFFPSLELSSAIGLQAFKPSYLVKFPESLLYNLGADLAGPLINRNAIRAEFNSASARQLQALYHYER
ncbi:MAG: TolC family protein, partial [Chitinophagaceae bacterium]